MESTHTQPPTGKGLKQEAEELMHLLNSLSLFSRRTLLEWLPELVKDSGLTEERFVVLFELELQPDISLKALAHNLVVSPSSLSVMINSLVEQELVTRLPDSDDRRRVVLRLSPAGERLLKEANERLIERFTGFLKELDPETRENLVTKSSALVQVVEQVLNRMK